MAPQSPKVVPDHSGLFNRLCCITWWSPMKAYPKKSAFTLLETIVTVIILGVLSALALPRYQSVLESMRSREGVSLLTSLMAAQKRYSLENGGAYTNNINNLDITLPAPKYFDALDTGSSALATSDPIVRLERNATEAQYGNYNLSITSGGTVSCTGGSGGICKKIGY